MLIIGRMISIPLGVVFFVLLLLTLMFLQVNDTFLDPDFYPEEMRKADVYEFVLVDLLTSAIDERRELERQKVGEGLEETPLITSGLSTQDIVLSVNRAVPPVWVQGLVEQSFDQVGRYLTGERDEFEFTLRAGEQVKISNEVWWTSSSLFCERPTPTSCCSSGWWTLQSRTPWRLGSCPSA